jgi:predicted metal-dependent hydrolase
MENWKDKEEFKNRVLHFAEKIGVKANHIALRQMKNKWASCSTRGYLTFNDELLSIEKDLGDYVIVHELLHFRAPNHGKLWKALMMAYLGDYEKMENRLRKLQQHHFNLQ